MTLLLASKRRSGSFESPVVVVAPPATAEPGMPSLSLISGNGQQGVVGASPALPLIVQLVDENGVPMAGEDVAWAISGGGAIDESEPTNAAGLSSVTPTLPDAVGSYTVTATVAGIGAITFTLTAIAGAAVTITPVSGDDQQGDTGAQLAQDFIGFVADGFGNPVAGAVADFVAVSGGGSLSAASDISDASGLVNVRLTLGGSVGTNTVSMTLNGVEGDPAITFSASGTSTGLVADTIVIISGSAQTAVVAGANSAALVAEVRDGATPVEGYTVPAVVVTGTGVLNFPTRVSGADGRVSFLVDTANLIETCVVHLDPDGLLGGPFVYTITSVAGPAAGLRFVQPPSNAGTSGQPLAVQPIVRPIDQFGNDATDTGNVVVTKVSGTLVVASGGTVALASNVATFTALTLTPVSGSGVLRFTRGSYFLDSGTITLAPPTPTELRVVSQPAGGIEGGTFTYSFEITDPNGVRITTDNTTVVSTALTPVTGAVLTGTSFTAASGLVSCVSSVSVAGTYAIEASAGSLTPATTNTFPITVPGADHDPGGLTLLFDRDFAVMPPLSPAAADVHGFRRYTAGSVLQVGSEASFGVPTCPVATGGIIRGAFGLGVNGGNAPFNIERTVSGTRTILYSDIYVLVDSGFTCTSSDGTPVTGTKLWFGSQESGYNHYVNFCNSSVNQAFGVNTQFPSGSTSNNRNMHGSFALSNYRNKWLRVENLLVSNTGGNADGIARTWVTDTTTGIITTALNKTDVLYFLSGGPHRFNFGPKWNPTWGGATSPGPDHPTSAGAQYIARWRAKAA